MRDFENPLSPRQQREREYYDEHALSKPRDEICFAPVELKESRPWNSYWHQMRQVTEAFSPTCRRMLEFGCGRGVDAIRYARSGYNVFGFDISTNNIENATSLAEDYGVADRTTFSVQAAEALQFDDDSFDIIVGTNILHHCDVKRSIRECFRVLRPGGIAYFREHAETPLIDPIRKSWPLIWLFPREMSIENHITEDERLLTAEDMKDIGDLFPSMNIERFGLFSRLNRVIKGCNGPLQKLDYRLFKMLPFLRRFGVDVVINLQKPTASPDGS